MHTCRSLNRTTILSSRDQPTFTGQPQSLGTGPLGELAHQLLATHTRLRLLDSIQIRDSLLIVNQISHSALLLPQEYAGELTAPAAGGPYAESWCRESWRRRLAIELHTEAGQDPSGYLGYVYPHHEYAVANPWDGRR